jgi:hypothetical protein
MIRYKNKITDQPMKKHISIILAMAVGAALLAACTPGAFAQSIGVNFTSDGNDSGIAGVNNAATNTDSSMLPADLAGVYPQTNWNNLGRYGNVNPAVLTNSAGNTVSLEINWDSGGADTTGTSARLGTPDGKLMDGFLYSWGPGAATTLAGSVYSSSINNKPLVYIGGLNSWYNSEGAEGYGVVLYTTGYSYWETEEGWIQSVSGNPLTSTMVEGTDLTPHVFEQNTGPFTGTYVQATGTSSGSRTAGANYMIFRGLTNDAVLIRLQSGGYGAGLNGFQVVPIFPTPPTAGTPAFSPSDTVYAGMPVTLTEVVTGDPFHPQLWYQWQSDNATGGLATNNILDATNATFTITPTNNVSTYTIQYQVIVTNIFGVTNSSVVTLTVNPAVAPFVTQDTIPGAGNGAAGVFAYVGGTVSFSAAFGGTPSTYLWQSNSVNIPNATNTTLTLANVQLSTSASYQLTATNIVGGVASTASTLTVLPAPAAPAASVPYPYDVFTNNPAAYWRFSETGDNVGSSIQAYDYSGHGYDATYGIGATDNQTGPQSPAYSGFETDNTGVALYNNVNNSFLTAPPLNLKTNTVTITAWINPASGQAAYNGLFTWTNGTDKAGFGFGGNSSNSMAELGYVWNTNSPSTVNFHSGLYPLAGQWSFVALTITPTNSTIYLYYIDGNTGITNLLKAVQTINNLSEPFSGGTTWIGSDTSASRNFNGSLDEVAVFGKALSEVQIQDLFLKGIGAAGVAPTVFSATMYPAAAVYSGQNVLLSAGATGTVPLALQWQAGPDGSTWTNVPGATASTLLANPLTVGTVYYQLVASNPVGSGTNTPVTVTFNALPVSPAGLWTANFEVTNRVLNYTSGGGVGHYFGRGILGTGMYWNVLPETGGAFDYAARIDSVSDLKDDGTTHSGIYCTMFSVSSFGFAAAVQPDSSDIGNLLYQWVTISTVTNAIQFHGVADGTYNLVLYGADGGWADRGTTFVVHDALNGDQTAGTVNAPPILPLQQGVNFVVFNSVHVSGGTLNVDVKPTTPVPSHDPNGEADVNGAQIQLVSYDVPAPTVTLNSTFTSTNKSLTLTWPQGILQTATNLLGPWTPINAPAPITVTTTNAAQFYRVKVQ